MTEPLTKVQLLLIARRLEQATKHDLAVLSLNQKEFSETEFVIATAMLNEMDTIIKRCNQLASEMV